MNAVVLALGVVALSSAAVLIRAAEAPALTVAFYRVYFSAAVLVALTAGTSREAWGRVRLRPAFLAGVALALHFWVWMRSLELTSVTTSTLLVTTTPVWIALAAPWLPHEVPLNRRGWVGLLVALAGGAWIAIGADTGSASSEVPSSVAGAGPLLALVGAWLMAAYLVIGRSARQRMPLAAYAAVTNLTAAALLGAIAVASAAPVTGFPRATWAVLVALALVPQLIGHNSLLWAVRTVGASVVSLVVLIEPIGASLLAWAFLDEAPTAAEAAGGAMLLLGLALIVRSRTRIVSRETKPG